MNRLDCYSEKISGRTLGVVILPLALFLVLAGSLVVPVVGALFALPLLLLSGGLMFAPESEACRLSTVKAPVKKNS